MLQNMKTSTIRRKRLGSDFIVIASVFNAINKCVQSQCIKYLELGSEYEELYDEITHAKPAAVKSLVLHRGYQRQVLTHSCGYCRCRSGEDARDRAAPAWIHANERGYRESGQ